MLFMRFDFGSIFILLAVCMLLLTVLVLSCENKQECGSEKYNPKTHFCQNGQIEILSLMQENP